MRLTAGARAVLLVALAANLLLASTFGAQPAHACSCSPGPTGEEGRLQGSDAVFSGVVVDVDTTVSTAKSNSRTPPSSPLPRGFERALVTFDVEESWKGVSEEPVIVRNAYQPGSTCEGGFDEGERYLVFAGSEQDEDVPLSADTHVCGGSSGKLNYAGKTLQTLGPANLAFPESVERERADTTPNTGFWSGSAPVVAAASAIVLLLAAVGAFAFWRWRHPS